MFGPRHAHREDVAWCPVPPADSAPDQVAEHARLAVPLRVHPSAGDEDDQPLPRAESDGDARVELVVLEDELMADALHHIVAAPVVLLLRFGAEAELPHREVVDVELPSAGFELMASEPAVDVRSDHPLTEAMAAEEETELGGGDARGSSPDLPAEVGTAERAVAAGRACSG